MGTASQAIGHFEQGTATSILALVDSPGHLVRFKLDLGPGGRPCECAAAAGGLGFRDSDRRQGLRCRRAGGENGIEFQDKGRADKAETALPADTKSGRKIEQSNFISEMSRQSGHVDFNFRHRFTRWFRRMNVNRPKAFLGVDSFKNRYPVSEFAKF